MGDSLISPAEAAQSPLTGFATLPGVGPSVRLSGRMPGPWALDLEKARQAREHGGRCLPLAPRRALSPFGAGAARPRSWRQRTVCAPGPEHSPGAHGGTQRSTQQGRSPVSAELFRARFLTAELQTLVLQVSL